MITAAFHVCTALLLPVVHVLVHQERFTNLSGAVGGLRAQVVSFVRCSRLGAWLSEPGLSASCRIPSCEPHAVLTGDGSDTAFMSLVEVELSAQWRTYMGGTSAVVSTLTE